MVHPHILSHELHRAFWHCVSGDPEIERWSSRARMSGTVTLVVGGSGWVLVNPPSPSLKPRVFIWLRSILSEGCANPGFFKYIYTIIHMPVPLSFLRYVAPDLLVLPGRHASHLGQTSVTHDLDSFIRVLTPL